MASASSPKHVLIVEDDQGVSNALEDILRDSGYSAEAASDGREALARMRERRPDLVVLDLMLPGLDGWGFLTARESDRELASVPVLVVSAVGPVGRRRAGDLGAPVFLPK